MVANKKIRPRRVRMNQQLRKKIRENQKRYEQQQERIVTAIEKLAGSFESFALSVDQMIEIAGRGADHVREVPRARKARRKAK